MAKLRVISLFTSLASVLTSALVAFRTRRASPPVAQLNAAGSRSTFEHGESQSQQRDDSRTWPPADGVYWGM